MSDHKRRDGGWLRSLWLVYLIFYLMGPLVFGGPDAWPRAAAGVAVFLVLYAWAGRVEGWPVLAPLAGMVALGVVESPDNPGASVFFVYAAAECARLDVPRRSWIALGAVALVVLASGRWIQPHPYFWLPALTLVLVVGIVNLHQREVCKANAKLARSQEEVARLARVAERERIARDLHDLLGHTLSVVILKSELAARVAEDDPERAIGEIREVESIARDALRQVREAVTVYRGERLETEIANAGRALEAAGVELDLALDEVELESPQESVLALALREAVTNVVRHAGATRCRVALRSDGDAVRLVVDDDGCGTAGADGAGLRGMRERVAGLGGLVERLSGDGTRLAIQLPRAGTW